MFTAVRNHINRSHSALPSEKDRDCQSRPVADYLLHEAEMNKGNLSSHLTRWEEAGHVEIEKTYRSKVPQTLLRLTRAGRSAFDQYRKGLKAAFQPHVPIISPAVPEKSGSIS